MNFTAEDLHNFFQYHDGNLYWKNVPSKNFNLNNTKVGKASTQSKYIQVSIKRKKYYLHRIIFMMHHGYMPDFIDHIDGNRRNNKIENLRQATLSQNQYNKKINKNNTSGIKGVYWNKHKQKWLARCYHDNKCHYVGSYNNLNDAENAIQTFRKSLHGEFARHH